MLPGQREADETEAGRRFINTMDWILWTEYTKGEQSPGREQVIVRTPDGRGQAVWRTQTLEYHMTGGEEMIKLENGSMGCHEVVGEIPCSKVYQRDVERAGLMKDAVTKVITEARRDRSNELPSRVHSSKNNEEPVAGRDKHGTAVNRENAITAWPAAERHSSETNGGSGSSSRIQSRKSSENSSKTSCSFWHTDGAADLDPLPRAEIRSKVKRPPAAYVVAQSAEELSMLPR